MCAPLSFSLLHCSTLRCTNVSLLALRVGRLITKIAARLGVFVVRSLCVCVLTFYVHTSVYGCMYVHNHYTLMQGSKTVPPTYERSGRGRARWRTGSAKCVRQHKEKNWFMRMCIHILKCISESDNRLSISTNWHSVYLAHTWIDYIHTRTHRVARPLVLLFCFSLWFRAFCQNSKKIRAQRKKENSKKMIITRESNWNSKSNQQPNKCWW